MATKVYKPKRKISATESEEIKIPASSVDGLSTVATSGSYNDLSNKPTIPSVPTNYVTTNTAQDITAEKKFLSTLIVGAKDDGSTGFKVIQGDIAGGDTLFTVSVNGIDLDAHEHSSFNRW